VKSKVPKFSKAEVNKIASVLHVIANERRLILFLEMIRSERQPSLHSPKLQGSASRRRLSIWTRCATQASFHFDVMRIPFGTGSSMLVFEILSKFLTESFAEMARIHHVTDIVWCQGGPRCRARGGRHCCCPHINLDSMPPRCGLVFDERKF
jgi:hypothetical protein